MWLDDALGVVAATIEEGKVLIGGGACEIDLVKQLREYGETVSGREQLAILKYAEALEVIPRTLIENAGLDTINLIADLKAAHEDNPFIGINVFEGKVVDMKEAGVIEPLRVKIQALQSAGEASEMILRIDEMIAARNALNSTGPDASNAWCRRYGWNASNDVKFLKFYTFFLFLIIHAYFLICFVKYVVFYCIYLIINGLGSNSFKSCPILSNKQVNYSSYFYHVNLL